MLHTDLLLILLAAITTVTSVAFVVLALLWLKKLRAAVTHNLNNSSEQHAQKYSQISEQLDLLKKQQRQYENHLQQIAEAHLQLRQDVIALAHRVAEDDKHHHSDEETRILH